MNAYDKTIVFWKNKNTKTEPGIDLALDHFRILFAYHSCKIENKEIEYHDVRDIFEHGKVAAFTGSTRALFEQQNQKLCYDFLRGKIACREKLSMDLIREVHGILTAGTYDEPPLIIYEEDRKRYYAALESYDTQEDIEPMAVFLREETVKTWAKSLELSAGGPPKSRKSLADMAE